MSSAAEMNCQITELLARLQQQQFTGSQVPKESRNKKDLLKEFEWMKEDINGGLEGRNLEEMRQKYDSEDDNEDTEQVNMKEEKYGMTYESSWSSNGTQDCKMMSAEDERGKEDEQQKQQYQSDQYQQFSEMKEVEGLKRNLNDLKELTEEEKAEWIDQVLDVQNRSHNSGEDHEREDDDVGGFMRLFAKSSEDNSNNRNAQIMFQSDDEEDEQEDEAEEEEDKVVEEEENEAEEGQPDELIDHDQQTYQDNYFNGEGFSAKVERDTISGEEARTDQNDEGEYLKEQLILQQLQEEQKISRQHEILKRQQQQREEEDNYLFGDHQREEDELERMLRELAIK